jgi:hypothetical protein
MPAEEQSRVCVFLRFKLGRDALVFLKSSYDLFSFDAMDGPLYRVLCVPDSINFRKTIPQEAREGVFQKYPPD